MPRLRIAVRVITEDAYIESLPQGPPGPPLYRGEKKFAVVISNPEQWSMGHLGVEIERQYGKIYRCNIGRIKHLVTQDNCELHEELNVWEYLADVDRAQYEYGDQHVIIKVVQAQGRAIREGSVVPDFTNPAYQHPPRPPVPTPTWSDRPSHLGKRPAARQFEQYQTLEGGSSLKRQRLHDIDEAEDERNVAPSVEGGIAEGDATSPDMRREKFPDLIEDSQPYQRQQPQLLLMGSANTSAEKKLLSSKGKHAATLSNGASDLPEISSKSYVESSEATRANVVDTKASTFREIRSGAGPLNIATRNSPKHVEDGSRAPITPDSEGSKMDSTNGQKSRFSIGTKRKSADAQEIPSGAGKFKAARQRSVFDFPESEIEDSQLSPKARLSNRLHASKANAAQMLSRARASEHDSFHRLIGLREVAGPVDGGTVTLADSTKRPRKEVKLDWRDEFTEVYNPPDSAADDELEAEDAGIATSESTDNFATPPASVEDMNRRRRSASMRSTSSTNKPKTKGESFQQNIHTDGEGSRRRKRGKKRSTIDNSQNGEFNRGNSASTDVDQPSTAIMKLPKLKITLDDNEATDSPSEQLLQMQASSQTPVTGLNVKKSATSNAKKGRNNLKRSEKASSEQQPAPNKSKAAKIFGSRTTVQQAQPSKANADKKADADLVFSKADDVLNLLSRTSPTRINAVIDVLNDGDGISTEAAKQEKVQSPEGRMGLGITDSPRKDRRTSSVSASALSVPPKGLRTEARGSKVSRLPTQDSSKSSFLRKIMNSTAATAGKTSGDTELAESEDYGSDSDDDDGDIEHLPSENKEHSKKPRPKVETEASSVNTLPPALKAESSNSCVLPVGMTPEQYEAHKRAFEGVTVLPKNKRSKDKPPTWDEIQRRAREVSLRSVSKSGSNDSASGSVSSGAKSERRDLTLKQRLAKEKNADTALVPPKASTLMSDDKKQGAGNDISSNARSTSKPGNSSRPTPKTSTKSVAKSASKPQPVSSNKPTSTKVAVQNPISKRPGLKDLGHLLDTTPAGSNAKLYSGRQPPAKARTSTPLSTAQTGSDDDDDDDSSEKGSEDDDEMIRKSAKKTVTKPDQSIRDVSEPESSESDE